MQRIWGGMGSAVTSTEEAETPVEDLVEEPTETTETTEETPSTEETASETEEVSDDEATEETTTEASEETEEAVVEATPIEEAEVIEEGEVDGAETYAIANNLTVNYSDTTDAGFTYSNQTTLIDTNVDANADVEFTVTPDSNYRIQEVKWYASESDMNADTNGTSVLASAAGNVYTIANTALESIVASAAGEIWVKAFAVKQYEVTVTGADADAVSSVKVNGQDAPQTLDEGAEAILTFTLDAAYTATVKGTDNNPITVEQDGSYKIASVSDTANSFAIETEKITYTFSITNTDGKATDIMYSLNDATATATMPTSVEHGDKVVVTFKAPATHNVEMDPTIGTLTAGATADDKTEYTLTIASVTANVASDIKTTQITYDVTETIDNTANLKDGAISYKDNCVAGGKINKGTDLVFTVTPVDDTKIIKSVTATVGGAKVGSASTPDATTGAVTYTALAADITGNVTINVVTADKPTTTNFTIAENTENMDTLTTVNYESGVYNGKVVENENIVFTVDTEDVKYEVTYKVGTKEAAVLPEAGGKYTIDATQVTIDGNVVITVTAQYDITFDITGATVKDTAQPPVDIADNAVKTVKKGETYSFTVDKGTYEVLRPITVTKTADGAESTDKVTESNNVYSITPTEAVTVTILAENYAAFDVTFAHDNDCAQTAKDVTKITDVTIDGTPATDAEFTNNILKAKENNVVTFKVAHNFGTDAENVYKVVSVKCGDKVLEKGTDDLYTLDLKDIKTAQTVTVDSMLDETKSSALTFAVTGGTKVSYTAAVEATDPTTGYADFILSTEDKLTTDAKVGDTVLTKNTAVKATVTAADGYTIDPKKITFGGEAVDQSKVEEVELNRKYKVALTLENGTPATLNVETAAEKLGDAKKLNVVNDSKHMSVTVKTNDFIKPATAPVVPFSTFGMSEYGYEVSADATEITFTVTAEAPYVPTVDVYDVTYAKEAKEGTYTYTVSAKALFEAAGTDVATIKIDEEVFDHVATVKYDAAQVEVTATVDGEEAAGADVTGGKNFTINGGSELLVTVTPLAGYVIDKAETKLTNDDKAEAKAETVKPEGFTFSIKAEADEKDTTTTITAKAVYSAAPLKDKDVELEAVNGVYMVDYAKSYTAGAKLGTADVTLLKDAAEVLVGRTPAASKVEVNGTTATIAVDAEDAGKTLTVNLYTEVEKPAAQADETPAAPTKEKVLAATYTLKVASALTSVKVEGVRSGNLTQTVDTVKTYKVTVTPNTANADLQVEVENKEGAIVGTPAIVDGKLTIQTYAGKDEKTATIKIYDASKPLEGGKKNYVNGGEFTVTAAVPAYADSAKPVVKFVTATDTTVTLSLALPKGVELPEAGELFYNITATEQAEQEGTAPAGTKKTHTEAVRVEVVDGKLAASQLATLKLINADEGKGGAWKYDVTATLEQTKTKADYAAGNVIFKSAAAELKNVATRNPWYEGKLGLKKKATTIYTGQEDVLTATAVFGKNTSYTRISAVEDTTKGLADEQKLVTKDEAFYADPANYTMDVVVDTVPYVTWDENTNWYKENPDHTAVGKHTLKVTAETADGMYAATATLTVNVVRGIEQIDFASGNYNIYKQTNRAASLKLTPFYNGITASDLGTKNGAPKAKKVTWDIVDTNGDSVLAKDHPLYKQITVSNGTVKVDKKYNAAKDETFAVIARAADYKESKVAWGVEVTITSKPQELGRIALVEAVDRWDSGIGEWVIDYYKILDTKNTFSVRDLQNARVVVFDKNAEVVEKDFYSPTELDDMLVQTPMTYKSSNAGALYVDLNGGWINSRKPGKNITLTATTTDGSKNSVQLKGINIAYEELELGLDIQRMDEYGVVDGKVLADYAFDTQTINYTGTKESYFEAFVYEKLENGAQADMIRNNEANYTLSVSGGKVLSKAKTGQYYAIQPTAQTTTLKLTNKVTGQVKEYKLVNAVDLKKLAAAPRVSTKDKLVAGNYLKDQTINYTFDTRKYDTAGKVLMVSADVKASQFTDKTRWSYYRIEDMSNEAINGLSYIKGNTFQMTFDNGYIPAGSYKLYFTFGHIGENGEFVAETKPATVNLKAVAPKKDSFKPTTSYKLAAADDYAALLTGKESGAVKVTWGAAAYPLLNANVNGQPNAFNELFEVVEEPVMVDNTLVDTNYYIKLKDKTALTADQLAKLDDKANLTGYIKCFATGDNAGVLVNDYVKVTVSLVPTTAKYAVTSATVLYADKTTATVEFAEKLKKGTRPVDIAYVEADTESGFTATVANDNNGVITLTADKPELTKHAVKLVVVPTDSYYAETIKNEKDATKKADLLDKFGIKVTANVTVTDNSETMISFTSKELQKTFTNDFYTPGVKGTYDVTSAFTEKVQSAITKVEVTAPAADATEEAKKENTLLKGLFTFTYDNAANVIEGHLDKAAFEKAVADNAVTLGAAINVPVTVSFGTITQNETFKYTLPKEKAQTFAEAQLVIRNYAWDTVKVDSVDVAYEKAVVNVLNNLVASGKLSITSDMDFALWNNEDMAANGVELAEVDDATVKATITLKNLATATDATQEVYLTKNAPTVIPQYVKDAITEFTTNTEQYVKPFATAADATYVKVAQTVRGAIKAIVEKDGNKMPTDLTIMIANANTAEGYFVMKPQAGNTGFVTSYIIVRDMKNGLLYGNDSTGAEDTTFRIAITALQTADEAAAAIEAALNEAALAGELNSGVTEASVMTIVESVITNADIKATWVEVPAQGDIPAHNKFAYTEPKADTAGSLVVGINLAYSASDAADATVDETVVIPETGAAAVAGKVEAAVTGDALAKLIADNASGLEAAIGTAATTALGTDTATYEAAVTDYAYTPAKATAEGSIKFTCTVTHKAGQDATANPAYTVAVITVDEKLAADGSLQDLAAAKTAAVAAVNALTLEGKDFLDDKVAATETAILAAAAGAIVNEKITVAAKQDNGLKVTTVPTVNKAGAAAITLEFTQDNGEAADTVETEVVNFTPAALPQTLAEAKTAATAAITALEWYKDMATETAATAAVKAAAEAVVKTSEYTVAVENVKFTAPTEDKDKNKVDGKYTATLSICHTDGNPSTIVFVNIDKTIKNADKPAVTPTP